jgi:hypothetical protein
VTRPDVESGGASAADLTPNPVYAQLEPAPPPAPVRRARPIKKKVAPKQPAAAPPP